MNQLQHFNFNGNDVRMVMKDGEPWWVAKDVCDILDYSNPRQAVTKLDEDEKGVSSIDTLGGIQEMTVINEAGLYTLVIGSRKQEARDFKRWVTHEVLPSIRQTGSYGENRLPQNYKEALIALIEQVDENEKLQLQIEADKPKVALYDTAMSAINNFTMERVSKTFGYGRNKLFAFLREMKVLRQNNLPYQEYLDRGYFDVREYSITHMSQGIENKTQTLVTPKGMSYIHKLLTEYGKIS